jgi:large subunit ribosomal protein L2
MAVRKFNPITPGTRHRIAPVFDNITAKRPEASLTEGIKSSGGRNHHGHTTVRFRERGHKKLYRIIDFKRNKDGIVATVSAIEYDPNRSARIALLAYADGEKRYIIAPDEIKVGDKLVSGERVSPDAGNCMPLRNMPTGTFVHNVEMKPGKGGQIARSAGTSAQLVAKTEVVATLRMPSGELRNVPIDCRATIGTTSNADHFNVTIGKAGRNRWLGKRPHNRGVAMNPVDHPMGGGEGKASGGHPRSPWGLKAKGKKTRDPKKLSSKFILRRRNAK